MKKYFFLVAILPMAFSATKIKKKDIVATVNGVPITKARLNNNYEIAKTFLTNKPLSKKTVLQDIINREINIQRAKKNKLQNNPLVRKKIDEILYHAQISKDLDPKLAKIKITEKDVKKFYSKNKEYRTSQVLFLLPTNATEEQIKAKLNTAKTVASQVRAEPARFSEYASKYSDALPSGGNGDVGFQPPTRYAPEYFRAINGKKIGSIIGPIRTQFGYHIVKITGVQKYSNIDVELYKKIIFDLTRDNIIKSHMAALRKKEKINVVDPLYKNDV